MPRRSASPQRRDEGSRRGRRERSREHSRRDERYGYTEEERERERERDRKRYRSRSRSPVNAKPNFGHSGLLAAETNTVKSVDGKNSTVLKYNEPPEARKPSLGWRLYVFKGEEQLGKSVLFRIAQIILPSPQIFFTFISRVRIFSEETSSLQTLPSTTLLVQSSTQLYNVRLSRPVAVLA